MENFGVKTQSYLDATIHPAPEVLDQARVLLLEPAARD